MVPESEPADAKEGCGELICEEAVEELSMDRVPASHACPPVHAYPPLVKSNWLSALSGVMSIP